MSPATPIRILNVNTHVGDSLRLGGYRRVRKEKQPDITTLQEVQRISARMRARALHNPLMWASVGLLPPSDSKGASGTLVFARRRRFKKMRLDSTNRMMTERIDGDPYHPERRLTKMVLKDRQTGALWRVMSAHTWTLGRSKGKGEYIALQHRNQVNVYVNQMRLAVRRNQRAIAIGDWNERVGDGSSLVEQRMLEANSSSARMDPADNTRHLDEAFVTPGTVTLVYQRIPQELLDTDHDGLYIEVKA